MPSSATYGALKAAAQDLEAWEVECDAARAVLRSTDLRGYIQVLLADGDDQLAWEIATAAPADTIHAELWLTLAESRETDDPADARAVYERIVDEVLETTDRRAYTRAAGPSSAPNPPRTPPASSKRSPNTSRVFASSTDGAPR